MAGDPGIVLKQKDITELRGNFKTLIGKRSNCFSNRFFYGKDVRELTEDTLKAEVDKGKHDSKMKESASLEELAKEMVDKMLPDWVFVGPVIVG